MMFALSGDNRGCWIAEHPTQISPKHAPAGDPRDTLGNWHPAQSGTGYIDEAFRPLQGHAPS